MANLHLSVEDLDVHVVKMGLDVHPPVVIGEERTRLHIFADEAREALPHLYDKVVESNTEFTISGTFRGKAHAGSPSAVVPTFAMTNRGPCFVFPLRLPAPIGTTDLDAEEWLLAFDTVRKLFFSSLPGRDCIRIGLVRELGFRTGTTPCTELLTTKMSLGEAKLIGGQKLLGYRDGKCNVRISIEPGELALQTTLAVGTKVSQPAGYGLQVTLDVNNHELRVLTDTDIDEILERASSFWPDVLIDYLNTIGAP